MNMLKMMIVLYMLILTSSALDNNSFYSINPAKLCKSSNTFATEEFGVQHGVSSQDCANACNSGIQASSAIGFSIYTGSNSLIPGCVCCKTFYNSVEEVDAITYNLASQGTAILLADVPGFGVYSAPFDVHKEERYCFQNNKGFLSNGFFSERYGNSSVEAFDVAANCGQACKNFVGFSVDSNNKCVCCSHLCSTAPGFGATVYKFHVPTEIAMVVQPEFENCVPEPNFEICFHEYANYMCLPQGYLTDLNDVTKQECFDACIAVPNHDCIAVNYDDDNQLCHLSGACQLPTSWNWTMVESDTYNAYKIDYWCPVALDENVCFNEPVNGLCSDHEEAYLNNLSGLEDSVEVCETLCMEDELCVAYSWKPTGGICIRSWGCQSLENYPAPHNWNTYFVIECTN